MNAENLVDNYINRIGWSKTDLEGSLETIFECREKILKMYLKEIKHIRKMNRTIKSFKYPIISNIFRENIRKEDYYYESEKELAEKAINSVNKCFTKK